MLVYSDMVLDLLVRWKAGNLPEELDFIVQTMLEMRVDLALLANGMDDVAGLFVEFSEPARLQNPAQMLSKILDFSNGEEARLCHQQKGMAKPSRCVVDRNDVLPICVQQRFGGSSGNISFEEIGIGIRCAECSQGCKRLCLAVVDPGHTAGANQSGGEALVLVLAGNILHLGNHYKRGNVFTAGAGAGNCLSYNENQPAILLVAKLKR